MDIKIETSLTLSNLVSLDRDDSAHRQIASLFLEAMNDWPTANQLRIQDFVEELKEHFGSRISVEIINSEKFNGDSNAWQLEATQSIAEMINISEKLFNETDFDNILKKMLDFYEQEFQKVDFIARLIYKTTEDGGRATAAKTGYRPQIKFDFSEMQTSGQQTFIDREFVEPGETVDAKIKIIASDFFVGCLREGLKFEFREGDRIIGTGEIIYLINARLEEST